MESQEELKFELFEVKKIYLREIPHPKLIIKSIQQLTKKYSLSAISLDSFQQNALGINEKNEALLPFLERYLQKNLQIKHAISLAATPLSLRHFLWILLYQQWIFFQKLQQYLPENTNLPDQDVKMSSPTDAYEVIKWIQARNLEESQIKDYLYTNILEKNTEFDSLTIACLRANKIILYV
jgi:hypothetical protein